MNRDNIERMIDLHLDRRLGMDDERRLAETLARDAGARAILAERENLRAMLRSVPEPRVPAKLLDGVLARVAQERAGAGRSARILPFARRVLLAATILFAAAFFALVADFTLNRPAKVNAGDPIGQPTIGDRLPGDAAGEHFGDAVKDYLEWRFLGRNR